jgi:hypothetical protein
MIHTVQVVDEDFDRYAAEMLKSIDVIFLERWTYQLFAGYWPSATGILLANSKTNAISI